MLKPLRKLIDLVLTILLIPVALLINVVTFIILTFTGFVGRAGRQSRQPVQPVEKLEASIVIPSWNGKELLATCLPSVEKAIDYCGGNHEIIVVDNGSSDGSADYIARNFPRVKVVTSPTNLGFGKAANLGIKASTKDIVIMLNNDMVVEEDFLSPLLNEFQGQSDLFAVSAQIFFWDRQSARQETGKTGARIRNGAIYPWHDLDIEGNSPLPVTYAGGGSSAYDRRKLLELGGFDELYHPFYVEDLDLSYMAWKRGWRIVLRPDSVVYHKHRGTIGTRFSETYIQSVIRKNEIVFFWKNISSIRYLAEHFLWLWFRVLRQTVGGNLGFTWAYFKALGQLGEVISRRFRESGAAQLSDNQVFARSTSLSAYREAYGPPKVVSPNKPLRILFVCPYIPFPPSHGGAVRMYNLLKQLSRQHEIYLLSFVENKKELDGYDHLLQYCKDVKLIMRKASWRKNSVLWLRPQSSLDEFYSLDFEKELARMVDKYDIDIIQYEYTQMAQYIKPFPRAKNVLTEHDITFVTRYRYFRSLKWSWEKIRAFMRWATMFVWELDICRHFDLICTVSTKDKFLLLDYDRRLPVSDAAPTGTDTTYYTPAKRSAVEPNSILFVGFFRHLPNVEGILYFCRNIYPLIKANNPHIKLYVVGSNPPQEVKDLARDPSIIITGFVEDLREYYAKAGVFVVPILRGAGTRVKIYEAMAAGIPIVSTTLGAEGIPVTDGKDIFLADNPQEFADKVISLLANPQLAEEMSTEARDLVVKNYEWSNIAERLAQEYYSLWSGPAC